MTILFNLTLIVQVVAALAMIGLILVQHGKGADAGAAFGGGGSASLFGASGGANFLSRSTAALASLFFVCTLALAYFGHSRPVSSGSVLQNAAAVEAPATAPAAEPAGAKQPAAGQIPGQ